MRLLLAFARSDPARSAVTVLCLILAAAAEGLGLSSLLPFLGLATRAPGGAAASAPEPTGFEGRVLDAFRAVGLNPTLEVLLGAVVTGLLVRSALMLLARRQVGYTVAQVATDMRLRLIRALLGTRWAYFVRQPIGSFSNAFGTEASRASEAFLSGATMLSELIALVVYGAVALATSWQITLAAIPLGLLTVGSLGRLVRVTRKAGRKQTDLLREVMARLADIFGGVKLLKVMAGRSPVSTLLESGTQRLNKALRRQVLSKEAVSTLQELLLMTYVVGGIYATVTVLRVELADVFLLALVFIRALTSMNKAQRSYQRMASDESAYWSMIEMIERAEGAREVLRGTRTPQLTHEIAVQDVAFRHGERRILDGVSLRVPAGEITALVGSSGSGKTTLLDLILGLVEPESGTIRVDGVPLEELDVAAWRRQIGYVPQEMFLLNDSLALNVSLGDPEVGRADIERALRDAGAWEFVSILPEGIDSPVGEHGSQLSGGQRQRVAIARALARSPQLLILDEATSALDEATEAAVWRQVASLRGRTTVLAVCHDPALLQVADHVYQLERGRVQALPPEKPQAARSPQLEGA